MADVHPLGAVLVGGKSRRMGRDKALIEIDGTPLVERLGAVLGASGCAPVVAIGPSELSGRIEHVDDLAPGAGPLGGILTALSLASPAVVVACDLPQLDVHAITALRDAAAAAIGEGRHVDAVMAHSDRPEPLCALWFERSHDRLRRRFDAGERAVHRAMEGLDLLFVDLPIEALRNVNRPEDLRNG